MTIDYFAAEDVPGDRDEPDWTPAHIGVLGDFRHEKGSLVVAGVIRKFCEARPGRDFFVQVQNAEQARALDTALREHGGRNLHIYAGQLSHGGYVQRLRSIEILLLPYYRERYAMRTSGIFAEAVAHGIVTVVPAGTWMEQQLAAGWGAGVSFGALSVDAVTGALIRASDDYAAFRETAAARRDEWRRRQSIPALLDHILSRLGVSVEDFGNDL